MNLPSGLSALLAKTLPDYQAKINITGTPGAPYSAPVQLVIPASALARGIAVSVAPNANAKWDILPPKREAALSDVTVKGYAGRPVVEKQCVITLVNDAFGAIPEGTDITPWFANMPAGLEAKSSAVADGTKSATAFIGGTPEETSAEAMRLTIPAARLQTGEALAGSENPDAKFDIASKIPPAASGADVAVAGEAGKPLAETTAHISLASAISAQSIAQGQPWTTLTFGAGDPQPLGRLREREYLRGGYRLSAYRIVFYEDPPIPSRLCLEEEQNPDWKTQLTLWLEGSGRQSFSRDNWNFDADTKTLKSEFAPLEYVSIPGDAELQGEWRGAVFSTGFIKQFAGEIYSGWFRNLPPGITAKNAKWSESGALEIEVVFSGTPAAESSAAMQILIPAMALNFDDEVPAAPNISAKWAIAGYPVSAAAGDAAVAGTAGKEITPVPIEISVSGDEFRQMTPGTDCSAWFTNLPAGRRSPLRKTRTQSSPLSRRPATLS